MQPMPPTVQQAVEYLVALLLVYAAVHVNGTASACAFGVAVLSAAIAAVSPGKLAVRRLLGPRTRRVADAVAAGTAVLVSVLAWDALFAVIPLIAAAIVLSRLALTKAFVPPPRAPRTSPIDKVQPQVNQVARAAGIFVRNRRNQRER